MAALLGRSGLDKAGREADMRCMLAPTKRPDLPASLTAAIVRGAKGNCPRCGEARLFRAFLKPIAHWHKMKRPYQQAILNLQFW